MVWLLTYNLSTNRMFRAVDVRAAFAKLRTPGTSNTEINRPISLAELPVTGELLVTRAARNQAVLSWRWDVGLQTEASRNVSAALAHAFDTGIEHLFIDRVSVDQTLNSSSLIQAVSDFTKLFSQIRVIAAYDSTAPHEDYRHFLRVLRRPWIARELRVMRFNSHKLQYVGHIAEQGAETSFGFAHMLQRIWSTSFANSILYVLTGYCGMHDVAELSLIMPEQRVLLSAAADNMMRNDVLITGAILAQLSTDDPRVNGDINIRDAPLHNYAFRQIEGSVGFWSNWEILLDGKRVGTWSEKDYTRDGNTRRKLAPDENAHEVLAAFLNVDIPAWDLARDKEMSSHQLEKNLERIEVFDLSNRFAT